MPPKSAVTDPADPAAPGFEADDEFLLEANEADEWKSVRLEEEPAGPPAETDSSVLSETVPSDETVAAQSDSLAQDPFKALAAQIIESFGSTQPAAPAVDSPGGAQSPEEFPPALAGEEAPKWEPAPPAAENVTRGFLSEAGEAGEFEVPDEPLEEDWSPPAAADAATLASGRDEAARHPGTLMEPAGPALGEVSAPRITVHAFCLDDDTAELMRGVARDRRMERATTTVRGGGLAAAVELYQNQPTPSLILVEARSDAEELLRPLAALAEVCDPGTKVIVIGSANDIALYRELMRRGVSEYLVPPLSTLQIIGAITSLYADPAAPFIGRQIAFCGARGGVGSSTLAHNLAHQLSERMSTGTVIVDLDLAFGTAGLDFNQDPLQGVADALAQPDRLDPVLMDRMMVKQSEHLSLFAAPANLDQDWEISSEAYEEVVRKVRHAAPYVILDLPHHWSKWPRRVLLTSDEVVIVAEPDLASLRNTKNIVDLVRAARPNDPPPKVILNKVGVPGRPEIPVKDFGEALSGPPDLVIAFDAKSFGEAANNGQMVGEAAKRSKAAESIAELALLITNQRVSASAPKSSLLARLLRGK